VGRWFCRVREGWERARGRDCGFVVQFGMVLLDAGVGCEVGGRKKKVNKE